MALTQGISRSIVFLFISFPRKNQPCKILKNIKIISFAYFDQNWLKWEQFNKSGFDN